MKRRKGRAILLAIALVSGVTLLATLLAVSKALRDEIDVMLDEYGANVVITAKPSTLPLNYGNITVPGFTGEPGEIEESDLPKIKQIKNSETINVVAPKLLVPATIEGNKVLLVGVRFDQELKLKKWWKLSGGKPAGSNEVVLGSKAAQVLSKNVGDALTINGRPFRISAVIKKVGSQEDDLVYADLSAVQELYGKRGKLTVVEVAAWCQTCPIERIVAQIGAKMPWAKVTSFKEVVAAKKNTLGIIDRFSLAIAVAVLLIGALVAASAMLSSVNQRIKEIGILRAIGYRKAQVVKVVLFDVLIVSLASGLLGWVAGTAAAKAIAEYMMGPRVSVGWSPATAGISIFLSTLTGMIAGYFPARRASNIEPIEALRSF